MPRPKPRHPPRDRGRRVAEYFDRGLSPDAVAAILGITVTTARRSFAARVARSSTARDLAEKRRRDDEIVRLYRKGLTLTQVAAQTGTPLESVRLRLIKRGVPRRTKAADFPHLRERDERMERLYRRGLGTGDIATREGLTIGGVRKVLVQRRVPMRTTTQMRDRALPHDKRRSTRDRTIAALYREGLSSAGIAHRLNLSGGIVLYALDRLGVPRRASSDYPKPETKRSAWIRTQVAKLAPTYDTGPGTSTGDFARKLGVTQGTVQKYMHALGVKLRPGSGRTTPITEVDARRIKRLLSSPGTTFREIAEAHGVTISCISSIAVGETWARVPWPKGRKYVRRRAVRA
ncbi:hypothetical protein PHYC_02742 [Phycisphaerales bacterium]|nr:hypothetical protein PHYC_02742 [Phycisphaerales bacterium]